MKLNQAMINNTLDKSQAELILRCDTHRDYIIETMIEFKQKVPNLYELTGSELTKLMKYCNELWEEKQWDLK